jgi:hypothetical protein
MGGVAAASMEALLVTSRARALAENPCAVRAAASFFENDRRAGGEDALSSGTISL